MKKKKTKKARNIIFDVVVLFIMMNEQQRKKQLEKSCDDNLTLWSYQHTSYISACKKKLTEIYIRDIGDDFLRESMDDAD